MVSVTAAAKCPLATRPDSTVISQAATPAAAPALADRATVATASAKAQTAVIGISQPKVTAAAAPDAETAEAARPRMAFTANTASARARSTIRSLIAMLQDSSQ